MNFKNDERVDLVRQMIDAEMQKKHPDMDFVNECLAALREWDTDMIKLTSEEVALRYEKLSASLEAKKKGNSAPAVGRKQSMPLWKRAILVAVAVLLVTALSLTVVAATTDGPFSDWIKTVLGAKPGDEVQGDGVTYIMTSNARQYKTMKAAWKAENIDLLYPSALPEGLKINRVHISESQGVQSLYLNYNDKRYSFSVEYDSHRLLNISTRESVVINGFDFYIYSNVGMVTDPLKISFGANLVYNGDLYTIQAPGYDELMLILTNIKEMTE